ncbi:MAG TPA: hypothetical protein VLQ89_08210 [Candidatus Binatia bacterium]|nr:hypothetical protein [Candidatus Binatia bacterium]
MKRIDYNLARQPKIDGRRFAVSLGVLLLALVVLNAVTVLNLTRLQRQARLENRDHRSIWRKMTDLDAQTRARQEQIAAWKKTRERSLAFANSLIARKSFSFIARLDFLEKACGAGTLVRQLAIVTEPAGRVQMTVSALAQPPLLRLYKRLLPYQLAIASENQTAESTQARLSFRISDEEK